MSHNGHTHFKNLEVKCTDFFIEKKINPLIDNIPQWSYTLLKSCSIFCKILKVSLTILGHFALKG